MQRRVSDKLNFEMSYGGKEMGSEENAPFVGKSEKPLGGGKSNLPSLHTGCSRAIGSSAEPAARLGALKVWSRLNGWRAAQQLQMQQSDVCLSMQNDSGTWQRGCLAVSTANTCQPVTADGRRGFYIACC